MLAVEGLITGCGDVVALHKAFGKVLRAFEDGTSLGGANHRDVLGTGIGFQFVVDTFHQRILWAYHHHVDAFLHTEGLDGLEIVGLHGDILAAVAGACIAWGDV